MAGLPSISTRTHLSLLLLPRLSVTALIFFTNVSIAEEIFLTVNIKKPLAVTSDKFLSYTIDPTVILTGNALTSNPERSVSMAKALSPAYVRISGPRSNSYSFVRQHHQSQYEEDPSFMFSETNWIDVHRWAENAGLDILACIASHHIDTRGGDSIWDSRNALDLISFSDEMGFNVSWQLGYECQTRCDGTGINVGKAVTRLRSMLDAFPRYSESFITGPDVVAYRTRQQQQYLLDYLNVAGNALSATTWHPNFSGVTVDAEGVSMHRDSLAIDRDLLYKVIGRSMGKKPLWLAESKSEDCKKQFLGALVWTRRLGNAAKLGVQVIMRQPDGSDLFRPTPDYWVSVLHKRLVGREVLETRITDDNRNHVYFYCQCTRPSSEYERGSLTIFGINLTPSKISVGLKGLKIKTIHKYILLPGYDAENRMFSETVLLNNEPLNLINDRELPEITPTVLNSSKVALKLPSGGIGFWVLPGLKIRPCGGAEDESTDKAFLRKLFKRFGAADSDEEIVNTGEDEGDRNNEDLSTDERRHYLKSGKSRRRRKHYYSNEDDMDRRHRRFEAKTDLERLEKLLRRRDGYVDRKSPSRKRAVHFDFIDASEEGSSNEDGGGGSQEMRDSLAQYENKIKLVESESPDKAVNATDGAMTIDSAKLMKAMDLLMKLENQPVQLDIPDEGNIQQVLTIFNRDEANVSSGPVNSSGDTHEHVKFLNDLLKSNKFERSGVPIQIENQLRTIYRILKDTTNQGKRDVAETLTIPEVNRSRTAKDLGRRSSMDPLDFQKEGIFHRVARFLVEVRDRRNRKKDLKDRNNERSVVILASKGSPRSKTPEDDVYLTIKDPAGKTTNGFDTSNDVDEPRNTRKSTTVSTRNERSMVSASHSWAGNKNTPIKYVPMEFSENFKMAAVTPAQGDLNGYELGEAESWNRIGYQRSNAVKDEAAALMGIVRKHDNPEKTSTRELGVEKEIGYYEDLGSHGDETTEYESAEEMDNTRSFPTTAMTHGGVPMTIMDEAAYRELKRESAKDSTTGEDKNSGHPGSSYDKRPIITSVEERAFSNYAVVDKTADTNGRRMKRSIDDGLEDILDREMIFQDDSNVKDCDCRVTRSVKGVNTRSSSKRENREDCPLAKRRLRTRSERRRNRKRDKPTPSKVVTDVIENHTETTRPKRSVESFDEEKLEFTIEEAKVIRDNEDDGKITTTEKPGLKETTDATVDDNSAFNKREGPFYDETTNEIAKDLSSLERGEVNMVKENSNSDEEIANVAAESEVSVVENVVNINNEETRSQNHLTLTDKPMMTESLAENAETMESSTLQVFTTAVEMNLETIETADAGPSRSKKNGNGITEEPERSEETSVTNHSDTSVLPSLEIAETSSADNNTRAIVSRTVVTVATNEISASDVPEVIAEESATKIDEVNTDNAEISTISGKQEEEDSQTSKIGTESPSSNTEGASTPRPSENDSAMGKKSTQRIRKSSKTINPVELRKTQRINPSSMFLARKKDNAEKAAKKLKRNEEARKLRKKLLQKREKLSNEHLEEAFGGFDKTDVESRKLRRRDIIGMIMNDEDLRDLVDSEKFEYLLRNKPINYETTECSNSDEYAEKMSKKYVPEVFEIVRPLHVTRERKVQPRKSNVRMNMDGKLLTRAVPQEAANFQKIRGRLDADPADHKIETRDGKQFYRIVESLENPKIYEQSSSYETQSAEVASLETEGSSESDESPEYYNREHFDDYGEECKYCDGLPRREYRRVFHSREESVRTPETFDGSTTDEKIFPSENSLEDFSGSNGEVLRFVKQKDYLDAAPIDNSWFDKNNHASRKRNLKNSDYRPETEHDNRKYARFTVDKNDFVRNSKVVEESVKDRRSLNLPNNDETVQKSKPERAREDTVERTFENDFSIDKRMRENAKAKNAASIDRAGLNEAIKSGNYELILLIPVNRSQVRSRRKRDLHDEVQKYQRNLIADIKNKKNMIRTPPTNNKEAMNDREMFTNEINDVDFFPEPLVKIAGPREDDRNSTLEGSTIAIVEGPKKLKGNDEKTLNEYSTEEISRNNPQVVSNDCEEVPADEGLSDLLEQTIPKLGATVSGGLGKVRRISESFEKFINDFDEGFDEKETDMGSNAENDFLISSNIFHVASTNLKKFFDFLAGLLQVFRQN